MDYKNLAYRIIMYMVQKYGHNWTCTQDDINNVAIFLKNGDAKILGNWTRSDKTMAEVFKNMTGKIVPNYEWMI